MAWSVMSRCSAQLPNQGKKKSTFLFLLSLLPLWCLRALQTSLPGETSSDTLWNLLVMCLFDTVGQKRKGKKRNHPTPVTFFSPHLHSSYAMRLKERRRDIWIFCICTAWIFTYCPWGTKTKKGLFHLGSALGLNSN